MGSQSSFTAGKAVLHGDSVLTVLQVVNPLLVYCCMQVWVRSWRLGPDGRPPAVLHLLWQRMCHSKLKVRVNH